MWTERFLEEIKLFVVTSEDRENPIDYRDLNQIDSDAVNQEVQRTICFQLPPFLNPNVWKKYQLSTSDVLEVLDPFPPRQLWSLCLFLRLNLSTAAIKPSYADSSNIIIQQKAGARQKLVEYITKNYKDSQQTWRRTFYTQDTHKPKIPVFLLESSILQEIADSVPIEGKKELRQAIYYPKCFLIRGNKYIAYEIHDHFSQRSKKRKHWQRYVLMVRIVSDYVYFTTYGIPDCLSMDPIYITLKDAEQQQHLYCGTQEVVYVTGE